ncbi:hypothetical protein ACFOWM_00170 [Ferruginibacter yonginensis]|uniref:Glycosyltransferase involved in cell wall biosynthesis n=1 Tax=Ferruginibacter yonginensis TaxID=1310416 RepID=A0ABV8QLU2_9BACT
MQPQQTTGNIVLVTSGQPSANPRLVKEALSLADAGYQVTVLYVPISPWATALDDALFATHRNIDWKQVGQNAENAPWRYKWLRLQSKCYGWLFRLMGPHFRWASYGQALYAKALLSAALQIKATHYRGHNLGALPAVVAAAKRYGATASFDFEDYHRGESAEGTLAQQQVVAIEQQFVPALSWATGASPLITEAYQQLFPQVPITTVQNCFTKAYALPTVTTIPQVPLQLFWFSQHVGKDRGLETVIAAMNLLPTQPIVLHLLGNVTPALKLYFNGLLRTTNSHLQQIIWHAPVAEAAIVSLASQCHIGLACEVPHIANRTVCLTNKIYMYLLAGNAIVYSQTKAQQQFWEQYSDTGCTYAPYDAAGLAAILANYATDAHLLQLHRKNSHALAQERLHWEAEQTSFLQLVAASISSPSTYATTSI